MGSKKRNRQRQQQIQKEKQAPTSVPSIGKKRLWAFRIAAMIIIPLILFFCLEVGLRIVGFGFPTSAIIKTGIDNPDVYHYNPKFAWRFFPKNISREFMPSAFDVRKTSQTYRVFVLGASAAAGVPEPFYNFGRIVKAMLADKYPQTKFEVVTLAMPAINSHAVLPIAKDCAKYQPDMFVVYLGNNEVVGPFGPGTVFSPMASNLSVIRANIAAKSTRTGQLFEQALQSRGKAPKHWGGMGMFMENQVRHSSEDLKYVYSHYENNLRDIIKAAKKSGAEIVISNVGSNLKDSPPFTSLHREDITAIEKQKWERIYNRGVEFEESGSYENAIKKYLVAEKIDSTFAGIQFRMGQCYWNLGEYQEAKARYVKAREYDTLRFRADSRINAIIQQVAENRTNEGVYFVDSVGALEKNSPHQIPGEELFYEHVHYKFEGNYIVAKTLLETIEEILPDTVKQQRNSHETLTLEQCKARLCQTGYEEYQTSHHVLNNLIKRPPFTNQLYHADLVAELEEEVETLKVYTEQPYLETVVSGYHQQIAEHPEDWKLRYKLGVVLKNGLVEPDLAMVEFKKVLTFLPDDLSYGSILSTLEKQEKYDEAIQYYHRLLKLKSGYWSIYYDYAKVLRKKGDYKKAIRYFWRSLKLNPMHSLDAYLYLADLYNQLGEKERSLNIIQDAMESFPKDAPVDNITLLPLLVELGQTQLAIDLYKQSLKVKPDLLPALNNLAWILAAHPNDATRDPALAIAYAQRSLELTEQVVQAKVLDTLAVAYASNGNFSKATSTAQKAVTMATQGGNKALAQRIENRLRSYQSGKKYIDTSLK